MQLTAHYGQWAHLHSTLCKIMTDYCQTFTFLMYISSTLQSQLSMHDCIFTALANSQGRSVGGRCDGEGVGLRCVCVWSGSLGLK